MAFMLSAAYLQQIIAFSACQKVQQIYLCIFCVSRSTLCAFAFLRSFIQISAFKLILSELQYECTSATNMQMVGTVAGVWSLISSGLCISAFYACLCGGIWRRFALSPETGNCGRILESRQ